jgi:prepilin-type N-terminal cleavage/methylation domain-containing protein
MNRHSTSPQGPVAEPVVPGNPQAGFSLIELMVALVVTMIITGAMYGLLTGGQNAFRREPELTDRQQAIRLGMARIQADVGIAGNRFPLYTQTFANNLDGFGTGAGGRPMTGPNGPTDVLQIVGSPPECPVIPVDNNTTVGVKVGGAMPLPDCFAEKSPMVLTYPSGGASFGWAHEETGGDGINFPPGQAGNFPDAGIQAQKDIDCPVPFTIKSSTCPPGVPNPEEPSFIAQAVVIRYLIAPDADGIPGLWRSELGGFSDSGSTVFDDPAAAPADAGWRLVARGVEDLQVEYNYPACAAVDDWCGTPGAMVFGDPTTVVREVRVTLGARTVQRNLAGATTSATGSAMRGQLVSVIAPRAILHNLSLITGAPEWY